MNVMDKHFSEFLTISTNSWITENPGNAVINDPVASVTAEVATLEGSGVDKIIALGHCGVDMDENIAQIEGVDIILGSGTEPPTFMYNVAPGKWISSSSSSSSFPSSSSWLKNLMWYSDQDQSLKHCSK